MARRIGLALLVALAGSAPASAVMPVPVPVAVELFTSQGCSSCPPADAVMAKFARDPGVVAITRPVTYWDRLGWKDTLARPANTALQRAYARRAIPGGGVYTPQSVIGGRSGAIGGQEAKIRLLIGEARRRPQPVLAVAEGGRAVSVRGAASGAAEVVVVALRRSVTVPVRTGENGGRRLTYANVLVGEHALGRWAGGAANFAIPAAARVAGADRYAVIVRQAGGGPILAARYLS